MPAYPCLRAARRGEDMLSAHASSSSTRWVRILTRAWWTHENHSQLRSRRSWRCRRWLRLCLLLEVVYPVLKTFCEGLEVLELILPTRSHLLLLLVVKEKQGEWATNDDARCKGGRELRIRHAMRTDRLKRASPRVNYHHIVDT